MDEKKHINRIFKILIIFLIIPLCSAQWVIVDSSPVQDMKQWEYQTQSSSGGLGLEEGEYSDNQNVTHESSFGRINNTSRSPLLPTLIGYFNLFMVGYGD